jgi:hypothetical protein
MPHAEAKPGPEESLGLCISTKDVNSFKDLHARATSVLEQWGRRHERILATVKRLAGRREAFKGWRDLAEGVVSEAYGAGLRYWLLQVYRFAGVPAVDTAEDLRWWCMLIFKVPQVAEKAEVGITWERHVPLPGCDEDEPVGFLEDLDEHGLLSELVASFPDEVLDPQFMGEFKFARWERIDYFYCVPRVDRAQRDEV